MGARFCHATAWAAPLAEQTRRVRYSVPEHGSVRNSLGAGLKHGFKIIFPNLHGQGCKTREAGLVRQPACRSGFQLAANFAALVGRTVHVDVEVAGLEAGILFVGKLGAALRRPTILARLYERNDHPAI